MDRTEYEQAIMADLAKGDDVNARIDLCDQLEQIIRTSEDGEIGIGNFTFALGVVLEKAKEYAAAFEGK